MRLIDYIYREQLITISVWENGRFTGSAFNGGLRASGFQITMEAAKKAIEKEVDDYLDLSVATWADLAEELTATLITDGCADRRVDPDVLRDLVLCLFRSVNGDLESV